MRDLVFRDLYDCSTRADSRFLKLCNDFRERNYRYDPDLEDALISELRNLSKICGLRWYNNQFYIFNGKIYVPVNHDAVLSAFKLWISSIGLKIAQKRKKELYRDEFLPDVKIGNKLKPRLDVIAFNNGVLDMSDYTFHKFSPDYHVLYYHPYKYDKSAKCAMWQTFLKQVLPDKMSRLILQMFLGLGLVERGTVYNQYEGKERSKVELCLILIGDGANGKSVIYQTAMGIFGKERISGIDYDELTGAGDEGMRSRRMLRDAIFNWSSDSDSRTFGRKRSGVFKRIVSGEPVTDRVIGGDVKQNFNLPYLVFNLNELPYPDDTSLGFIRRLQFISFDVTIPKERQNKTLAHDLTKEYSGIFNWVLRGSQELKRRKFVFPDSEGSHRQLLLAQLQGNPTIAWVNAYHVRSAPQAKGEQYITVPAKEILRCIDEFCTDNDTISPNQQLIGRTLSRLGFEKSRQAAGYEYKLYGVSMSDLLYSFVIRNESFGIYEEFEKSQAETLTDKND